MIVLDTDVLTLLQWSDSDKASQIYAELKDRFDEGLTTTIINYEEQMRGWMGFIAKARTTAKESEAYRRLQQNLDFSCGVVVLPFDDAAAARYQELRHTKVRIGTTDLKIASIVLANDAELLTRNWKDFQEVPGLKLDELGRSLF